MDPRVRAGIFKGESGGDYNTLFGFSNRPGKQFANNQLTNMTVDQAIAFSDPNGPYAQWVKSQVGRVATPMGAYQIVGTTLRAMKNKLGLTGTERMTPELQDKLGDAILADQGTGAWAGYKGPADPNSVKSPALRHVGGAGSGAANFTTDGGAGGPAYTPVPPPEQTPAQVTGDALGDIAAAQYNPFGSLGATLADAVGKSKSQLQTSELSAPPPQVHAPRNIDIPLPQRAPDAPVLTDLASLFKVAPVGQPTAVDSKTGRPIMRRGYG